MRLTVLVGEALRTAVAQRVSSVMLALLCAAICAATLLTVGRTAAAEDQLLVRLDTAGSRLLEVTDEQGVGLITPQAVEAVGRLDTAERVIGSGIPSDVVNAVIGDGGDRVPAWTVTGPLDDAVVLTAGRWPEPGEALVAADAQHTLGLVHPVGTVQDTAAHRTPIVGEFTAREPFERFDAGVVIRNDGSDPARSLYVVVDDVDAARITEAAVVATLAPARLQDVAIGSPAALAELQQVVSGDLGDHGRGLLVLTLGGGAALIGVIVLAETLLRRTDLGRRRAIGAPRWALVVIVVTRTIAASAPGAVAGIIVGAAVTRSWAELPPWDFMTGTAALTIFAAGAAAIPPALLAANRDPVTILRTP